MITSLANDRVRRVVSYVEKSKARREDGVFIIEGMKMLREAPVLQVSEVFVTEKFADQAGEEDKEILWRYGAETVSEEVMDKMSDTQTPQGVLAVVRHYDYTLDEVIEGYSAGSEEGKTSPLILILENIQDPGNLGTMLRSGEGAGVTGVVLTKGCADIYNPKVIRSTMGSIFRVPYVYVESASRIVRALEDRGIHTYAAHLKGRQNYDEFDYTRPTAFLIGNEGKGLTIEAAEAAGTKILIPMKGEVESMNAATSSAILTFEAARQRRRVKR
ncbi:MAG: RNA methyltransferase [Butyrivibrio sp.]|nr:RNA methyltransferase [Butyrivibrio sp.]